MGITGLLPFLDEASRKCYIGEFSGCTVAIDSYCWLHKGAFACAQKLVRGESTDVYVKYCFKYIKLLQSHNIKPILVFDGQFLPAKKETEKKRRDQREVARQRYTDLLRLGKTSEAHKYIQQCVNITHSMALNLIKECRSNNVDCIVAPYEADAQLAYLNKCGIADIVITEDSDLILFGCRKILYKFNVDGSGILVEHDKLNRAMKLRPDQYTFDKFRYMCIMSGCDYLDSLRGIGLKKALKAISLTHEPDIYKLLPRLPRYLNLSKLIVTKEYIENFKLADATIKHQIVYDPLQRKLTPLTDPVEAGTSSEYLKNAGEIGDDTKAFQMALGNIDPITLEIMDNWIPDIDTQTNPGSIWSETYKKVPVQSKTKFMSITSRKVTKPIEFELSPQDVLVQQQEYDRKLADDLNIYHLEKPMPKPDGERCKIKDVYVKPVFNPFRRTSKLSKFETTHVEDQKQITSRFFSEQVTECVKNDTVLNCPTSGQTENGKLDLETVAFNNTDKLLPEATPNDCNSPESSFTQDSLNQIMSNSKRNYSPTTDSDDESKRTSPILLRSSKGLQTFRYNSSKKLYKRFNMEKAFVEKVHLNDDLESTPSSSKESDIENSTPEVDTIDLSLPTEMPLKRTSSPKEATVKSKVGLTRCVRKGSAEAALKRTSTLTKKGVTMPCRQVGLSRNIKKGSQPTILSMFNKMTTPH